MVWMCEENDSGLFRFQKRRAKKGEEHIAEAAARTGSRHEHRMQASSPSEPIYQVGRSLEEMVLGAMDDRSNFGHDGRLSGFFPIPSRFGPIQVFRRENERFAGWRGG